MRVSASVGAAGMVLLGALGSCTAPRPTGAQCAFSSDCLAPLVCASSYCRTQCMTDRDCPNGQHCLQGADPTANLCIAPVGSQDFQALCGASNPCQADLGMVRQCVAGLCVPVSCLTDNDCARFSPSAPRCGVDHACVVPGADAGAPDAAPDVAPEASLEGAVDAALDASSDAALDATSDARDATPEAADAALDVTPEAAPADAAGDALDAAPEAGDAGPPDYSRPLSPLSTALSTSARPTFRWRVGATDTPPSSLLLCRDRALRSGCVTLSGAAGATSASPTGALARGVWFWQLQGTSRGAAAPVWQLHVAPAAGAGAAARSFGTTLDGNGDGLADLAVGASGNPSTAGRVHVYQGVAGGALPMVPTVSLDGTDPVNGNFGYGVASAGDVDGDGFADLLVGAEGEAARLGRAYLYRGSAAGFARTPATTLVGRDGAGGQFAWCVSSAGDVDGDGYADVLVGANAAAGTIGRAYLYRGGSAGLNTTPVATLVGPDGTNGNFGVSVAGPGDLDGDGLSDIAVGASGGSTMPGHVYLYAGATSGLASGMLANLTGPGGAGGGFGSSVAAAGDVNGDGRPDLLVGAPNESSGRGTAYLYLGGAAGLGATPLALPAPDANGHFGFFVAGAGDLNADGYADFVVGAPDYMGGTGRAYVFLGGATPSASPVVALTGPDGRGALFGRSASGVGDLNGDGFSDLAVGAWTANTNAGRVYVYSGAASVTPFAAPLPLNGPDGNDGYFGYPVALAPRCLSGRCLPWRS